MTDTAFFKLKLTALSDTELLFERWFDAPRELVYKAMTEPDLIPKWWGWRTSTTIVDVMDVRPGGEWRYIERAEDGVEHAFRGEFREVVPPSRLVMTFEYEPMPGQIVVNDLILDEIGGQTRFRAILTFGSIAERDGMVQSGMEQGASETYERLAELLATM